MSTVAEPAAASRPELWPAPPPRWRLWVALGAVLAVALFTRLWRLDLMDFKADEAQIAGLALDAASGVWPATSIQTSDGLFNPPLPVYIFGFAGLFTRDPAWQAAIIGLLDVLGVLAVFLVGRRYFCGRVGLAGAGFYAANAYATIFARKLAGPFLQPLFAILLLGCLLELAVSRKPSGITNQGTGAREPASWFWAPAVVLLAILIQLHLGALLLVPVVAVLFLLSRPAAQAWLWAAAGGLLALLIFLPYLIFESSHQPDFVGRLLGAAGGSPAWGLGVFRLIWITITSPGYGDLTGPVSGLFNSESWFAGWITPLAGAAALGGLAIALGHWRDRRYLTLCIFVLLPLLLLLRHTTDLRIHYFVFLEPAIFLLAGVGFDVVLLAWPRLRLLAFALLGLLLAVQTGNLWHFTEFLQRHALPSDGYGVPLAYQQRVFDEVLGLAKGRLVVAAARNRDEAFPAGYFLRDAGYGLDDANDGLVLPENGVVVTMSQRSPVAQVLSQAFQPTYKGQLPGGEDYAAVYTVGPDGLQTVQERLGMVTRSDSWSNGLQLTGVAAPRALPGLLVAAWRAANAVSGSVTFFSHVLDDGSTQWFGRDGTPVPPMYWRAWPAGTNLITVANATLPPDAPLQEYWWSLGMYGTDGQRVPLTNGDSETQVARLKGGTPAASNATFAPANAMFGNLIQLSGYAADGDGVTLRWASVRPVDQDYTVFVHAVDASGKLLAQTDSQPNDGRYPTSLWDGGEIVVDHHALAIPQGAALEVGFYELASGRRLMTQGGADHVVLRPAT